MFSILEIPRKLQIVTAILILSVSSTDAYSQTDTILTSKSHKELTKVAVEQITKLESGTLLVMLHSRKNSINALKKSGQTDLANSVRAKQEKLNKTLINAFNSVFNFCPVYFFMNDELPLVTNNELDRVTFLDNDLNPNKGIKPEVTYFLICEYGNINSDPDAHFGHNYYDQTGKGLEKKSANYTSTNFGFRALVISDQTSRQLRKPFPYYVKSNESISFDKNAVKMVKKLNSKLLKYYNRNND